MDKNQLILDHIVHARAGAIRTWKQYGMPIDREDAIACGLLGLVQAAATFNPKRGASFKTFAGYRIRGAVLDEIRREVPRKKVEVDLESAQLPFLSMGEPWLAGLRAAYGGLPHRIKRILQMYYGKGMTFLEIAAVLGFHESRACQLHTEALATLRRALKVRT